MRQDAKTDDDGDDDDATPRVLKIAHATLQILSYLQAASSVRSTWAMTRSTKCFQTVTPSQLLSEFVLLNTTLAA